MSAYTGWEPPCDAWAPNCRPLDWLNATYIFGSGFEEGLTLRLTMAGQSDIVATIQWLDLNSTPQVISAKWPITDAAPGLWDLDVTNPDSQGNTLVGAVEIVDCPPPTIDSISPNRVIDSTTSVKFTILGADLIYSTLDSTLTLRQVGWPDIVASADFFAFDTSPTDPVFATVDLTGAPLGAYDIIFTRADGESVTLPGAFSIAPDPGVRMRTVAAWGGQVNDVFVDPNEPDIAYVAAGQRLVVLDVADPADVQELGSIILGNMVWDVEVRDGYAYVCTDRTPYFFCVVDVSDPTEMQLVWHYANDNYYCANTVALYGNYAYVLDGTDLDVFDISDPTDGQRLGGVVASVARVHTVRGDLLYVGETNTGPSQPPFLRIYNLAASPTSPPLVGSVQFDFDAVGGYAPPVAIDLEGDYAYLSLDRPSFPDPITVVNIANPQIPTVAGYYSPDTGFQLIKDIVLNSGYAYVADWTSGPNPVGWADAEGLVVIDMATDPANPTLVSTFKTHGRVWRVRTYGDRAYVLDDGEGLIILDVSNPANPVRIGGDDGGWYSPAGLRQIDEAADRLYVTDAWNGLSILDVSDQAVPAVVGVYQTPQTGWHMDHWGVRVGDHVAFLTAGYDQLQAVDVADPARPSLLGGAEYPHAYKLLGLQVCGNVAHAGYAASDDYGMVNFNIGDPQNMDVVGAVITASSPTYSIDATPARIASLAGGAAGGRLTSVDTSVPAAPFVLTDLTPAGIDLVRDGELLYVANNNAHIEDRGGLLVFDVSNAAALLQLSHFGAPQGAAVAVQNHVAYLTAAGSAGRALLVLDVSDPAAPLLLAERPVRSTIDANDGGDILVDGRTVFVSAGSDDSAAACGLTILDVGIPGDADADWDVDLADFAALQLCFGVAGGGNPGATSGLTARCLFADFDEDDDVDADDFALFADAFTGVDPPTTDPTGACCLPDGTCRDNVTEPDCTWRLGGVYQGDDSTCDGVSCPPTGACCLPFGSILCENWTEDACTRHGGVWYGEGTDCSQGWCPFGTCCDPTNGSCSELRPDACEASGGIYMGDGTDCATTQCQFAFYENTITPMTSMALAGAGLQIADDLTLDGDPAARDLTYLDLRVYGNGGGTFDVTVSLYTDCPGNGGTLIPGTTFDWTVPDDGYVYELAADFIDPPVTIPDTVWMVVTFTTPESGWIIAEQAEVGYTENWYGWLNPWDCNRTITGHYAGLWANLRCIVGGRKSDGGDGGHDETRLHTIKLDTPVTLRAIKGRESEN